MKYFFQFIIACDLSGCSIWYKAQTHQGRISGIHPELAFYSNEGECEIGAVVPWAGSLWAITCGFHSPFGSSDKLYQITSDKKMTVRSKSIFLGGGHQLAG